MVLNGNWVDLVILLILAFFVFESWRVGLWIILADFISFSLSLLLALTSYQFAADLLRSNFSLSHSISNALGFLLTAIISESILGFLFIKFLSRLPEKIKYSKWSRVLGVFPALGEAVVLISFLLTLVMSFPIKPSIKRDISDSRIGGMIIEKTTNIEKRLTGIFGGVIEDSLTYLTIKPDSHESVPLNVDNLELTSDLQAESDMFKLVNVERKKVGAKELVWDPRLVPVARGHATDMWKRKYFAHVSPDGEDVGDRLDKKGIEYSLAGENLALAPTTQTAHSGLMNSEGHRKNILEDNFVKIGIGVIDNGYYGKMFVQVFTD